MKKILAIMLALSMVFALAACGGKDDSASSETDNQAAGNEAEKGEAENSDAENNDTKEDSNTEADNKTEEAIKVGLVTDTGGIDDKSFNQSTFEGIKMFYANNNWDESNAVYLQSNAEEDYIPNLSSYADEEMDLIVAPGFKFNSSMTEVATNYPEQKFLLIDSVLDPALDNVTCAVFAEHEGSYLVGVATALKAKEAGKTKVGFIGGDDFPLINKFEAGFEQGVKAIDPEMEISSEYAMTFSDTSIVQTIAAKMYDDGCYVIYHAAGGAGNGLFKEAKDRVNNGEDVWACGVDKDQYSDGILEEGSDKSVVLTSMMKRVDIAACDVSQEVLEGKFEGGNVLVFDLKNEGVDLPAENPNLKPEWIDEVNSYKEKIKSGEIVVDEVPSNKK